VKVKLHLIAVLLLAFAVVGCKTTKKDVPAPVAPPPVEAPAPPPAPVEQPEPVEEPGLPTDADALNRLARENGWIKDAFFAYDSNVLSSEARANLELSARWLKENPEVKLTVEGHCDERGSEEYNLALGARRAKSVYDYMVQLGVDPARMRTISYGESMPVDPRSTEEAWRKNRRAHFAVIQD